ncbi:MAG: hypothetical protein ACRD8Z_11590, partial [Nitrososphaeraceae archaeon]
MKIASLSIFKIVLVLLSGLSLISSPSAMNNVTAKYSPANIQTQSNAIDCYTNINCYKFTTDTEET